MPHLTAGFLIQLVYNVFYFLVSGAIKATGNRQIQDDFDVVCESIEKLFKDLN
jgi:hypothetical protein